MLTDVFAMFAASPASIMETACAGLGPGYGAQGAGLIACGLGQEHKGPQNNRYLFGWVEREP